MGARIMKLLSIGLIVLLGAGISFAQTAQVVLTGGAPNPSLKTLIEGNTAALLNELEAKGHTGKSLAKIREVSSEAFSSLEQLWASDPFFPLDIEVYGNLLKTPAGFQLRGIQVQLTKGKATEELVISYDLKGAVSDVRFAISQHQYTAVMGSGADVKDFRRRQYVLDFVENYRTAYNRKDIPFIQKVFSDNALIIVGKVLKDVPNSEGTSMGLDTKKVSLVTYNKKQYMSQLQSTFKKNQVVKVGFDSISVQQHPNSQKDEWYGVTLKQVWNSTAYSDTGYVFLLIDFTKETEPTIWVRAWQPGKETRPAEVLSLGDFEIVE